ncbi:hypothetical protein PG985_005897 [Apiospora marii]|uniref:uncharacterized protein n=1 Tax=Apiospora marii TaxID=335849 RepID=UPI00312D9882
MAWYDESNVMDFAVTAVNEVSNISLGIAVKQSRPQYGILGTVLFLGCQLIANEEHNQREWVQRNVPKLLRDLDGMICGYHINARNGKWTSDGWPHLLDLAEANHGTKQYVRARAKIEKGLLTMDYSTVKELAAYVHIFLKRAGADTASAEEPKPSPTTTPPAFAKEVKLVYKVLFRHSICTCDTPTSLHEQARHLTRLMLPVPASDEKGTMRWDFLFSSKPSSNLTKQVGWQDLALHLPPPEKSISAKRVHFGSEAGTMISEMKRQDYQHVRKGALCQVLQAETNSRISLMVQDGKLQQRLAAEPLAQIVDQSPSLSLASILKAYTLTGRMKAMLAHILAFSTWQFYESDWLNTPWNSDTIHFLRQPDRKNPHGDPKVYATRPYFAASFDATDPWFSESIMTRGLIHRYPRMRAVGIMLVEIGIGSVIHQPPDGGSQMDTVKRANADWSTALEMVNSESPWPDCDFPPYKINTPATHHPCYAPAITTKNSIFGLSLKSSVFGGVGGCVARVVREGGVDLREAVRACLDPETFVCVPFSPSDTDDERDEKLERRKRLVYDKVVSPLEGILNGTGWKNEISSTGPLEKYRTTTRDQLEPEVAITQETRSTEKKSAEKWLRMVDSLNRKIMGMTTCVLRPERVKIAILDTGYDPDTPFFLPYKRRIIGWKDWAGFELFAVDIYGYKTYLLGLIIRIAFKTDIFVARVIKTSADLDNVDNIAKRDYKADLITIRSVINNRDELVIFFAAVTNSGANVIKLFPARHKSVISIRGTSSNGYTADFNPPLNPREYCALATLGVEVPSQPLSTDTSQRSAVKSGTSIATAISIGIAGLLLTYVNRQLGRPSYHEVKSRLLTRRGMLAMLESISTPSIHREYLYIKP